MTRRSLRTFLLQVAVTVPHFFLGLLVAILFNRDYAHQFFRTIIFLPVILGVTIQGLIGTLFLYPLGRPIANLFAVVRLPPEFLGGASMEPFFWVVTVGYP